MHYFLYYSICGEYCRTMSTDIIRSSAGAYLKPVPLHVYYIATVLHLITEKHNIYYILLTTIKTEGQRYTHVNLALRYGVGSYEFKVRAEKMACWLGALACSQHTL